MTKKTTTKIDKDPAVAIAGFADKHGIPASFVARYLELNPGSRKLLAGVQVTGPAMHRADEINREEMRKLRARYNC